MIISALLIPSPFARAQESAGQAEVAMQGYYLSGSNQPLSQTSGIAENSTQFVKHIGLVTTNIEGYGGDGFHSGNMFAGVQGTPILGWHWDFVAGDFHRSSYLVENLFSNVYTPEIASRGLSVAMRRAGRSYEFSTGEDTVQQGPRIPYRSLVPQMITAFSMQQHVGDHLIIGARLLNLRTKHNAPITDATYFLAGRNYARSTNLDLQVTYLFTKELKLYGQAGYAWARTFNPSPVAQRPFSFLIGPSWQTSKFTVRANYVRQSTTYMPLLGYFAGDRTGPYAEAHYRPVARLDLYGSISRYGNNLENNPAVATFRSSGYTLGASVVLPWKFSVSNSITTLGLAEQAPGSTSSIPSANRQITLTVSRPVSRHNLRFAVTDMQLNTNAQPQTQHFQEVEDSFTWKHFVFGGAMRVQSSETAADNVNTLFFRGSIQANIKRVSIYAYTEKGHDLVNQSIFSTNSMSSSVMGLNAPLSHGWNLQFEAFKNQLLTQLNPENVFLFANSGQGLNTQLSNVNQRSIYFKLGKRYSWGRMMDPGSTLQQYAAVQAPLVGTIQGLVLEKAAEGNRPAPNVAIILDHNRTATTDDSGHYAFSDVPEGLHEVGLDMEQLPADYAPPEDSAAHLTVLPRTQVRSDFSVIRLASITGVVIAPKEVQVQDVAIRLVGKQLYTTPYDDGSFSFFNLPEGQYVLEVDLKTIPDGYVLGSPERLELTASSVEPSAPVHFQIKLRPQSVKPVRDMFNQQIHVNAPATEPGH